MPRVVQIDSLDDPRVDVYRDVRDADLRGRDKMFMAESELVVRRLLRTPQRLHSLFLSPNKYERLRDAVEVVPDEFDFPIYLAQVELISSVAGFLIHRGALAAGYRPGKDDLAIDSALRAVLSRERLMVVLVQGVTNVDNMGGLFRNAAAFGIDGVVLDPTCCDPLYRKAIRVSVGHTLSVPYAVSDDWLRDLERLKREWGITLIGAESAPAPGIVPLWEIPKSDRIGVVFGSEATGLSPETLALCDVVAEVPMARDVPSLNVATASAVFLYELRRGAVIPAQAGIQ